MATIHLDGKITDEGKLEVKLPAGLPAGEARVTIELGPVTIDLGPETGWSSEEVARALKVEAMTGAEIVAAGFTGGWEGEGIADGAEWVDRQRRARREQRR